MMKYIFCILLGVFLCWGFHLIFNEAQEAYRLEAGSNGIQTYSYSYSYTSKASKILRFNIPSVTIRILSSLKIQLPKNQWTGFSYYTNLFKYSDRYHIYSLGHILI